MANLNGKTETNGSAPALPPDVDPRVAIVIDEISQRTAWEQKRCLELRVLNQGLIVRVQQLERENADLKSQLAEPTTSRKRGK